PAVRRAPGGVQTGGRCAVCAGIPASPWQVTSFFIFFLIITGSGSFINDGGGASDAYGRDGQFAPARTAADAVRRQRDRPLPGFQGRYGVGTADAVQRPAGIPQRVQRVLQDQHIGAAAAPADGGVPGGGVGAGGGAVAAVEMDPGGRHGKRLHIAPGAGSGGRGMDLFPRSAAGTLPDVKGHAGIMLAGGAVAAFPDAFERIPHGDAAPIAAAGEVPGFHGRHRGPQYVGAAGAPEFTYRQRIAVAVGHRLIFAAVVSVKLVGVDRKSTRLNSSHVSISYAVFCLKKKKNNS